MLIAAPLLVGSFSNRHLQGALNQPNLGAIPYSVFRNVGQAMTPPARQGSDRFTSMAFYALAYASSAAVQKGVGFVLFIWLAQQLTVAEYAEFGLLYALMTGVATMAGAGVVDSVIGLLGENRETEKRIRLFSAANGVFLLLSLVVVIPAGAIFFVVLDSMSGGFALFASVLAGGVLTSYLVYQATLIRLDERHFVSVVIGLLGPLGGFTGALVGFYFGRSVELFFAGMAIGLLIVPVVLWVRGIGYFRCLVSRSDMQPIFGFLGPYVAIAILGWLGGYGNTYAVKILFEDYQVAQFVFAFTLSSAMQLVATSTNQVWSPRFFRIVHSTSPSDLESANARFYLLQGLAIGIAGAAILMIFPVAVDMLGGNLSAYQDIDTELFFLFAGYAVSIPWWHAQNYFLAYGAGSTLLRSVAFSSFGGLIVWIILMILIGDFGIYFGFFVYMSIRAGWVFLTARYRWNLRLVWQGVSVSLLILGLPLMWPIVLSWYS